MFQLGNYAKAKQAFASSKKILSAYSKHTIMNIDSIWQWCSSRGPQRQNKGSRKDVCNSINLLPLIACGSTLYLPMESPDASLPSQARACSM